MNIHANIALIMKTAIENREIGEAEQMRVWDAIGEACSEDDDFGNKKLAKLNARIIRRFYPMMYGIEQDEDIGGEDQ